MEVLESFYIITLLEVLSVGLFTLLKPNSIVIVIVIVTLVK